MILSVSRRTDIPCYFSDWFLNRLKEGYVLVRNPMNMHQVSKITLSPKTIDCIVFWTKNPLPLLDKLSEIKDYPYYFQFTINSYGKDIEPNVPSKSDIIIPAFKRLSQQIGADRVIWRYDPILLNQTYTPEYHARYFKKIAKRLCGYTKKCTISFLDSYRSIIKNVNILGIQPMNEDEMHDIASCLSKIAFQYGMAMDTCSEKIDLSDLSISNAKCIDESLIEKIIGCKLNVQKDKFQRAECMCAASIDIGAYNTCSNGCKYCYASYSPKSIVQNISWHDPNSPLLYGSLSCEDKITERKVKSLKDCQITFDSI